MRIKGNEGEILSEQEINDSCQNYANTFSTDESFLQFIIFGKRFIKALLAVEGAKGLKLKMALRYNDQTGTQQLYPIPVAVDKHGNELPFPEDVEVDEEQDEEGGIQIMGDDDPAPVRCPASCS